jgi:hypothetical protein
MSHTVPYTTSTTTAYGTSQGTPYSTPTYDQTYGGLSFKYISPELEESLKEINIPTAGSSSSPDYLSNSVFSTNNNYTQGVARTPSNIGLPEEITFNLPKDLKVEIEEIKIPGDGSGGDTTSMFNAENIGLAFKGLGAATAAFNAYTAYKNFKATKDMYNKQYALQREQLDMTKDEINRRRKFNERVVADFNK